MKVCSLMLPHYNYLFEAAILTLPYQGYLIEALGLRHPCWKPHTRYQNLGLFDCQMNNLYKVCWGLFCNLHLHFVINLCSIYFKSTQQNFLVVEEAKTLEPSIQFQ